MAKKRRAKQGKSKKTKSSRKYSSAASEEVGKEIRRYERGTARSGPGGKAKVTSRKQAIAIALSEARENGMKVPKRAAKKRK